VPWLLWFGRPAPAWPRQLAALAGGLALLFIVHEWIDNRLGVPAGQSVSNALSHFGNLSYSLRRAASPKGAGELLSIFGLFTLIPLLALAWQRRTRGLAQLGSREFTLAAVVGAHMLLSGDLGRMGYLAVPVFCTMLALVFTQWRRLLQA
jgi:hypothetical protein